MKKIILYFFGFLSILLLFDIILNYGYDMSFRGYYTDAILFWLWFISSICIIIFYWKKRIAKFFLGGITFIIILSIVPLGLPFYTLLYSMTPAGLKYNKNLNEKYRAQIVGYDVMSYPHLEIIEKIGLLEKKRIVCDEFNIIQFSETIKEDKYEMFHNYVNQIKDSDDILLINENEELIIIGLKFINQSKLLTFNKKTGNLEHLELINNENK